MGKLLLVRSSVEDEEVSETTVIRNAASLRRNASNNDIPIDEITPGKTMRVHYDKMNHYRTTTDSGETQYLIESQMKEMRHALIHIKNSLAERQGIDYKTKIIANAWRDVALVLDRFFFLVYIILIVVSLITLFPRPQ